MFDRTEEATMKPTTEAANMFWWMSKHNTKDRVRDRQRPTRRNGRRATHNVDSNNRSRPRSIEQATKHPERRQAGNHQESPNSLTHTTPRHPPQPKHQKKEASSPYHPIKGGEYSEKEKSRVPRKVWHQKFRPERPRRTIHDG